MKMKIIKSRIKRRINVITLDRIIAFIIFSLFSFSLLYALIWCILSSFKDPIEYIINKHAFFPEKWLVGNYLEAFRLLEVKGVNIFGMIFNSLWMTFGRSLISLAVCSTTSYIMSKYDFVGKKTINTIIIGSMMIPLYGSGGATLKLYLDTGMYNSPLILLASASGVGAMFLIMRSYYNGVSWEYAEAARIDGANDLQIYLRVMIPLAKPCLLSLGLVMLIEGWNDWGMSIYYMPDYPTLASGLYTYEKISAQNVNYPVYFAGIVISFIPTMLLFIFFNEKIMNSITTGGLKG